MHRLPFYSSLKPILLADAATCLAMGLLLVLPSGTIASLTALPETLVFEAGLILLPVAAFILAVATRRAIPAAGVVIVIAGNLGWAAASFLILFAGWVVPNALGTAFVTVQAIAVLAITALEYRALRLASAGGYAQSLA